MEAQAPLGGWADRVGKGMCEEGRGPRRVPYRVYGELWVWAPFPEGPLHPQMLQAPGSSPHSTLVLTKAPLGFAIMKGIGQEGKEWTSVRIPPPWGLYPTLGSCG